MIDSIKKILTLFVCTVMVCAGVITLSNNAVTAAADEEPINQAPTATPASFTLDEDTSVQFKLSGTDPDGDALTFQVASPTAHGSLELYRDQKTFSYMPSQGYHGTDSFTFRAYDGKALSEPATVTFTVNSVNDVPRGLPKSYSINKNTSLNEKFTAFDLDTDAILTFSIETAPTHGTLIIDSKTGEYSYTPNPGYSGQDSFTYLVYDGEAYSAPAAITITITGVNDTPLASSTGIIVDEDKTTNGSLNGTDPDGDPLTFIKISDPAHGTVTLISETGAFTYTPAPNYNGPDSFTFKVNDGSLSSAPATVGITVNSINDVPLAAPASASTKAGQALTGTLSGTDADAGTTLTFARSTDPAHGTVTINATSGEYTYTPTAGYSGSDSFTFTVNDGIATSTEAAISLTIEAPPVSGGGGGNGGNGGSTGSTGGSISGGGNSVSVGKETQTVVNGQKVTTVTLDQKLIEAKLETEGKHAVITIAGEQQSDVFIAELNGEILNLMEEQQAAIEVKTSAATYTIPAEQINIEAIAKQLGVSMDELKGIRVQLEVGEPAADMLQVVDDASKSGHFEVVVPPVTFQVTAQYGNSKVEINKFNAYVERTIAILDAVDPNQITTGIVVEPDGTVRHVPTKVVQMGGKYYAVVNSLTNSTYALISHAISFKDMSNHWAEKAVTGMSSRLIINGIGNDLFKPNQDITRAEFVAIVVRGLGLQLVEGDSPYSDVAAKDWYSRIVSTAVSYRLINGFEDGTFRPSDKVTREQAMTIIAKAMKLTALQSGTTSKPAEEVLHPFTDAIQVSSWAIQGTADCLESGIITGRRAALIAPKANMTRAEAATVIQRLLEKSELI